MHSAHSSVPYIANCSWPTAFIEDSLGKPVYCVVSPGELGFRKAESEERLHGNSISLQHGKSFLNCRNILNTWFCEHSTEARQVYEYNPDTQLAIGKWCRGSYTEIEHKLNIHINLDGLYALFDTLAFRGFPKSESSVTTSFEQYVMLNNVRAGQISARGYAVIHERIGEPPNAIKYKVRIPGRILSRKVTILDYSEGNVQKVERLLSGRECMPFESRLCLPTFSKSKKRCTVIDASHGFIFGVSYAISRVTTNAEQKLGQVEVEYWSRLAPVDFHCDQSTFRLQRNRSHRRLVDAVRSVLIGAGFIVDEQQTTKIEWLRALYETSVHNK